MEDMQHFARPRRIACESLRVPEQSHNPKKKFLKWPASLEMARDPGTIAKSTRRTTSPLSRRISGSG